MVKLVQPQGLRISEKEVTWSLDVARFVEIRSDVKVEVRNVPPGVTFSAYPSTALAVFRCQFPSKGNPLETTRFYVDYRDFASSVSGRCVAHCENLPQYVIDWHLEPEVFDCMVREDAQ